MLQISVTFLVVMWGLLGVTVRIIIKEVIMENLTTPKAILFGLGLIALAIA